MPKLTDADRTRIKTANAGAYILRTPAAPDDQFVFRDPTLTEFDAFLMALNGGDATEKARAHRTLARDVLLFPAAGEWDAFAEERPGLAHTLGVEVSNRSGLGAEVFLDVL